MTIATCTLYIAVSIFVLFHCQNTYKNYLSPYITNPLAPTLVDITNKTVMYYFVNCKFVIYFCYNFSNHATTSFYLLKSNFDVIFLLIIDFIVSL